MRVATLLLALTALAVAPLTPAFAWWDAAHMQIVDAEARDGFASIVTNDASAQISDIAYDDAL